MSIGKDKVRSALTIEKDFKAQLEEIAKENNRSFNNMVITILKEYVKENEKKGK